MSNDRYPHLYDKINEALSDRSKSDLLFGCMKRGRDSRTTALESLPGGAAFRDDVRKTKERCIENHGELKKRFIENVRKRGATVFEAQTAEDVISYRLDLARKRGAGTIVTESSVCSIQLAEGTGLPVYHPLQLLKLYQETT